MTLDFIVQPRVAPHTSLAEDAYFLQSVTQPTRTHLGVLRVYDFAGDVLSLGRYHLAPDAQSDHSAVQLHRRHTGGRAAPFGDGFIGVSLCLPHRSALVSADPLALAPYQVLNRYVRGIMEACRIAGVEPIYPGRDVLTINRRISGMLSLEVDETGATLFEAVIANRRDFSLLPEMLEKVDRAGAIKAEMLLPENVTCLAHALGTSLTLEEVAELLRRGYEKQFNLTCEPRALAADDEPTLEAMQAAQFADDRWIQQRRLTPDFDRHAWARVQLGMLEVHFSLAPNRTIQDIRLAGDFIANSSAVETIERRLRGCRVEASAIDAVMNDVFAQPHNYMLGIGPLGTIAAIIMKELRE